MKISLFPFAFQKLTLKKVCMGSVAWVTLFFSSLDLELHG